MSSAKVGKRRKPITTKQPPAPSDSHAEIEDWMIHQVMPDMHPIVERLDESIRETIPGLHYAVKWKSAYYGLPELGWIIEMAPEWIEQAGRVGFPRPLAARGLSFPTRRAQTLHCLHPLTGWWRSPLGGLDHPDVLRLIATMAPTRRAGMFTAGRKPSDHDPRDNGPTLGDERTTLVEALRWARLTLEIKCSGLDAEAMVRRSVEPSTMSLLGLVRHLAEAERGTFRAMMSGQDVPRLFCSDADPDGDFDGAVAYPQVVTEAWEAWRAEVGFAERFVAEAPSLDITGISPLNEHGSGGDPVSLREVLVGMIWEYGRHMGHVDLLRERIDGRIGQKLGTRDSLCVLRLPTHDFG